MVRILQGDCIEVLKTIPDCSVQTCVTSPPYYGLKSFGTTGEVAIKHGRDYIGIELNPKYIELTHKRLAKVPVKLI